MLTRTLLVVCSALAALLGTATQAAEVYPSKPIRLIVPFAAGGGNDNIARLVGQMLAKSMGQPVLVDNRPGAGGSLGAEMASKAPVFAGRKACDEGHSEITIKLAKGDHKQLSCEGCHGVSLNHVGNPDITPVKLTGSHCIRCHEANPTRPAWFHQITVKNHYSEQKCTECHVPHQPNEVP